MVWPSISRTTSNVTNGATVSILIPLFMLFGNDIVFRPSVDFRSMRVKGASAVGEFWYNKRNGQGTMTYADGRIEEGIWKSEVFQYSKKVTPPVVLIYQDVQLNGSCQSMLSSTTPSTSNATFYLAAFSRRFEPRHSLSGIKIG